LKVDRYLNALAAVGLHQTRPRRLIAERLAQHAAAGDDFSTDELWHDVQRDDSRLGRATVFRLVETLVGLGMLDRVVYADGTHRFRACGERHHHHLTCVQCRQVVEVPLCLPDDQFQAIADQTGFSIEGHALEVFGRCPACRSMRSSDAGA
jgi:Fur family ferric uptake transcriptional regulator